MSKINVHDILFETLVNVFNSIISEPLLIVFFLSIPVIKIISVIVKDGSYKSAGSRGEHYLYRVLLSRFKKHEIIKNAYLTKENGDITEIDLIAVSRRGVYVFESKNYSGLILGNENNSKWVQILNKNNKHKFFNPILQNLGHIKAIKHNLNLNGFSDIPIFSFVVFGRRCKIKIDEVTLSNTYVTTIDNLISIIKKIVHEHKEILSTEQKDGIISLLFKASQVDEHIKEKHIQQIKDNFSK